MFNRYSIRFRLSLIVIMTAIVLPSSAEPMDSGDIDWKYQMTYQRGIEGMNWALPAVSMLCMRDADFGLGGGFNTVYWLSEVPTALQEAITPNNQTPYASVFLTTKDGPVILDVPPATEKTAIFGSAINVWQEPIADIGPAGTDQGRGGRYLFLPPGYEGDIPDDVFLIRSELYGIYVALRCIPLGDTTFAEAAAYSKQINAYPLSQLNDPPEGLYVDMAGKHVPTLPVYDLSFFKRTSDLLDEEPLLERDKVMGGMLASIGIEKGKPFRPEGKVKEALEKAATDGYDYLEHTFETPGFSMDLYWPDRQWMGLLEPSKEGFVYDEGPTMLLDEHGSLYHWITFIPRRLGKASAYIAALSDSSGELLSGKATYRLRVPEKVPARDFWSVIAYSKRTKAFIYSDFGRVDIYLAESAPAGLESNWIPTAGEDFFLLFRFYGPQDAYFDRTFKLPDLEKLR